MIQGTIFDMDGVLIDSMPVWEQAGGWYLESQGRKPQEGLKEILFTKSMQESAEYMKEMYDIPKTTDEIVEGVIQIIRHQYEAEIPAKKGVLGFLEGLKSAGIKIVVATSSDRVLAEAGLKRLGILDYVEAIFTCKEAGAGKEYPDVYLRAWESMGTEREATWVFEDVLHGIRTAKKAGFSTVGVYDASSEANQERIREEATVFLEDLTDFDKFYALADAAKRSR